MFESSFLVFLGLYSISKDLVNHCSDKPQLACVLFGDSVQQVLYLLNSLFVLFEGEHADQTVEGEFVDVQRAETNIWQVSLTARMTRCVLVLSYLFTPPRLIVVPFLWVKNFVCVHYSWALVKVSHSFFVFTQVNLHHASVKVEVFSVKYVFLVVVSFVFVFLLGDVIFT